MILCKNYVCILILHDNMIAITSIGFIKIMKIINKYILKLAFQMRM